MAHRVLMRSTMKTQMLALVFVAGSTSLAAADPPVPGETTIGIGLGIENRPIAGIVAPGIGGLLSGPTVGSVRVRFPSGLSIEPSVSVGRSAAEVPGSMASATNVSAGAAVRFAVARRGSAQLLGVVGVAGSRASSEMDGVTSTARSAQLSWGLAIDYWVQSHLAVSVSAANPLVSHFRQDDYSATTYGVMLDPTIAMMVHLFY